MKHLFTFGLLFASIFSWFLLITTDVSGENALQEALASAEQYEQEELYIKAIESYRKAVSLAEDNYAYKIAMIEDYEKLGDLESAISLCETLISTDPNKVDCYLRLLQYYKEDKNYSKLVPMILGASEKFPGQEEILAYREEIEKMHTVDITAYSDITMFYNGRALASPVTLNEEDPKENLVIDERGALDGETLSYKEIRFTDTPGQYVVKTEEDQWQVVNEDGYPVAKCKDEAPEDIGVMFEGCANAKGSSAYLLMNQELAKSKMTWDFVGSFSEGVAPVQIGGKWGLMSIGNIKADAALCTYEDIALDEFGRCCINNRIFVKDKGAYYLVNEKGERITDAGFEEAKVFASNQPAAVKQGGKWGFISSEGEMVIDPQFEEAQSFSNGYASVRQGDKWGIINASGTVVVEPQFTQVKYASASGVIPVLDDTGYWNLLKMYKLYYNS